MSEAPTLELEWTPGSLRLLRTLNRGGATLAHMALRMGVGSEDIDRALWALLGRTPAQACEYLRGRA